MDEGDTLLYYHSGSERAVVGVARVVRTAYPDPTAAPGDKGGWVCVDLAPVRALSSPVPLRRIKADPALARIGLVRQSRLSVMSLQVAEFDRILTLSQTQPT